jgi:hypothetical protein
VKTPKSVSDGLRRHLETNLPGPREEFVWTLGPASQALPRLRIVRVSPRANNPWAYVTVGAWEGSSPSPHGTEFLLLAPFEDPRHVELLTMIAFLHSNPAHRLGVGSIVPIGRPWADGSLADQLLVSLPYPYGPTLEHYESEGNHIQILWVVPITTAEADLARRDGLAALEELFEESQINLLDPRRRSVVNRVSA